MKLLKTRRSAFTGGRAMMKKKSQRVSFKPRTSKRKKTVIENKTVKPSSILKIVPDVITPRKKKTGKIRTPELSTSSESFSVPGSSDSSKYFTPGLLPPLVIDSPTAHCGQPAFSFADGSFESSDAEVSVQPQILKRKVLRQAPTEAKRFKRKRTSSSASISSEDIISKQEKDIGLFPVREWGLLIAVLSHPMSVKLSGPALFQVISGSVKILGHVVEQFHGVVPLFSASKIMCLDIKTESTESICRQASRLQVVKDLLLQVRVPESMADRILNLCDNSSVIVGFRKNFRFCNVNFASSLMPSVFSLKTKKINLKSTDFKDFGFKIYTDSSEDLDFPQCENFISDVFSSIKDSDEKGISGPRIIVQGIKGMGKSTFLRYAINRVLNEFDAVYYLDGDPGQSEFTPGGCVSLVKVTSPLLGPPFTHLTTPEKMYYLGTVNVQAVAEKYSTCVKLLCEYYKEKRSIFPLFVNTMGWVVGIGLKLLKELKSFVEPTHIVKIVDEDLRGSRGRFRMDVELMCSTAKEYSYGKFAPTDESKTLMNPADLRDLSMISYLGKCLKKYSEFSLNSITPCCLRWKDVAVYACKDKHTTEHALHIFNGSWVALLSIKETVVVECDDFVLPKFLPEEPVGEDCYGFGVIRGIDTVKKVFYILTPVPEDRLKKVNAIMISGIHFPRIVYTQQNAGEQLHYAVELTGKTSIVSGSVPRRKFLPKKTETLLLSD